MGSCSIFNGRVGMTVTDNEIYRIIVDIMDIQNEPENIFELDNWIRQIGLQEVYKKIIQIYSIAMRFILWFNIDAFLSRVGVES